MPNGATDWSYPTSLALHAGCRPEDLGFFPEALQKNNAEAALSIVANSSTTMERRAAKSLESTAKHPNAKETGLEAASLGNACVDSDRRTKRRKISDNLPIADELISVCHATPQATHISSEQAHELTNRAQGFLTTEEQAAAVETKRVTAITKFCEVLDGAGKYEYRYVEQLDAQFKIIAAISLGKHKAKKAITGWGLFKNRFSEEDFTVWLRSWLLPLNKLKKPDIFMRLKSLTTGNDFLMGINDEVEYSEVKNKKERMTLALKCLAGIYINKDIASFASFDFKSNTRQEPIEFKMATAVKKFCDILDDKKCASKDLKDIHASFKGIVKNFFHRKELRKHWRDGKFLAIDFLIKVCLIGSESFCFL